MVCTPSLIAAHAVHARPWWMNCSHPSWVSKAVLVAGPPSGEHLNLALSFAMAVFRRGSLPRWELPHFVCSPS